MMDTILEFVDAYGEYIVLFLLGSLLTHLMWFIKYPDEFIGLFVKYVDDEDADQDVEIEEIDHATHEG